MADPNPPSLPSLRRTVRVLREQCVIAWALVRLTHERAVDLSAHGDLRGLLDRAEAASRRAYEKARRLDNRLRPPRSSRGG